MNGKVVKHGIVMKFLNGELHCSNGPAYVDYLTGDKKWYRHGQLHRINGPAVIYSDRSFEWYDHGELHRLDGPAVLTSDVKQIWYRRGKIHRVDGPAIIDNKKSEYMWYIDGKRHRRDGPAVETIYMKAWYWNDMLHREESPALELYSLMHDKYLSEIYKMPYCKKRKWYLFGEIYEKGLLSIAIAMSPLDLPPYVLLWILEWSHPRIQSLNQPKIMALLEGIRNSRQRLKDDKN